MIREPSQAKTKPIQTTFQITKQIQTTLELGMSTAAACCFIMPRRVLQDGQHLPVRGLGLIRHIVQQGLHIDVRRVEIIPQPRVSIREAPGLKASAAAATRRVGRRAVVHTRLEYVAIKKGLLLQPSRVANAAEEGNARNVHFGDVHLQAQGHLEHG
jgi:hypothetical protein